MKNIRRLSICLLFLHISCANDESDCGTTESSAGIVGTFGIQTISWNNFTSSENNDCTVPGAPVSLLLEGVQEMSDRLFTLCLPRPDRLKDAAITFSDESLIQVISIFADSDDCLVSVDTSSPILGTIEFEGVCQNARHPDGYGISVNASVPITLTCLDETTSDTMLLNGNAKVREVTPSAL